MNVWDIVKTVGAGVISSVVPGGALLVGAINEFLPNDKKLPAGATGTDLDAAVKSLSSEDQALLVSKQFDVDITQIKQSNETLREMLKSDAANPHSTRPYIAKGAFHVVAFVAITAISIWAYGVFAKDPILVKAVMDGWPFVVGVIAPFIILLNAYFGVLKQEHQNRLDASNGNKTSAFTGVLANWLKSK